jgi:hypothetical protein
VGIGQHLKQEQISAWLMGERSPESIQHVRNCSACRAEVLLLGTTLLDFRSSVREWSQKHATAAVVPAPAALHQSPFTFNRACLATAAVIACMWLGMSLRPSNPANPTSAGITDRALMSQVDDQISRTVPTAMEPLLPLVAWQGDASEPVATGLSKQQSQGAAN